MANWLRSHTVISVAGLGTSLYFPCSLTILQRQFRDILVHGDPRLENARHGVPAVYTYGDVPSPRAQALRAFRPGDLLVFLANLAPYDPGSRTLQRSAGAFYFVGFIEVATVAEHWPYVHWLQDRRTGERLEFEQFASNAHVVQCSVLPDKYLGQRFTIFEGSPRSRRFEHAVELTAKLCTASLLDASGQPFELKKFPSLASAIGSYTRSIRAHFDLSRPEDAVRWSSFVELTGFPLDGSAVD